MPEPKYEPISESISITYLKTGCTVFLADNAHIGRAKKIKWANITGRVKPEEFEHLEAIVTVDKDKVSRNHCAIVNKDGRYHIMDMGSLNRTSLYTSDGEDNAPIREVRLEKMRLYLLHSGDIINLAPNPEFPESVARLQVKLNEPMHHGLLIGNTSVYFPEVEPALGNLRYALKTGLDLKDLEMLVNGSATKEGVLESFKRLRPLMTDHSYLILHYLGAAAENGVQLSHGDIMTPGELYKELADMRGRKVVFLDCPHANNFLTRNIPENTKVIAAKCVYHNLNEIGNLTGELTKYFYKLGEAREAADAKKSAHVNKQDMQESINHALPQGKYNSRHTNTDGKRKNPTMVHFDDKDIKCHSRQHPFDSAQGISGSDNAPYERGARENAIHPPVSGSSGSGDSDEEGDGYLPDGSFVDPCPEVRDAREFLRQGPNSDDPWTKMFDVQPPKKTLKDRVKRLFRK